MMLENVGDNLTGNLGMIPTEDFSFITYNELLQSYSQMVGDKMFIAAIGLFVYVLLNMFVFNEGARFRKRFDELDDIYIPQIKGTVAALVFVIVQSFAFAWALMLVMFNIIYRMGLKI